MVMLWLGRLMVVAGALARDVWYVQALRCDAEIRRRNVMDHVAASALAAVVVACRLIALAVCRAVVVDHDAVLAALLVAHKAMHVLIQVIMVEMIVMMSVRAIRRGVCSRKIAMVMMIA
jgi:hypothetical protein